MSETLFAGVLTVYAEVLIRVRNLFIDKVEINGEKRGKRGLGFFIYFRFASIREFTYSWNKDVSKGGISSHNVTK